MGGFRLDRNTGSAQTAKEAADHAVIYRKLTWQERLRIAAYLNSGAYRYDVDHPPRLDRTRFSARSLKK